MGWRCRRRDGLQGGGDRREAAQRRNALVRRPNGRQGLLLESAVRREAVSADPAALAEREQDPFGKLTLPQAQAQIALDDLERVLRGRKKDSLLASAEPERPAAAARDKHRV